jgi:hypothetical protein
MGDDYLYRRLKCRGLRKALLLALAKRTSGVSIDQFGSCTFTSKTRKAKEMVGGWIKNKWGDG